MDRDAKLLCIIIGIMVLYFAAVTAVPSITMPLTVITIIISAGVGFWDTRELTKEVIEEMKKQKK
jgi:FtsH-binding integral membrane protein